MQRIPTSPPIIAPISSTEARPRWSVMIPVYNCGKYLPDVLNSVCSQNIPEDFMQIEVVDDASTDVDVKAIVELYGKGRINYFRQEVNVGSLRNFETCLNRAKGDIVHLLHGDDRVKPGFYEKMNSLFLKFPEVGAAICRYNYIHEDGSFESVQPLEMDEEGILENWLLRIAEVSRVQYVSIAVKREVYERLGAFYGLTYGEDWEMWVRMAQFYRVAYTPDLLAEYRLHENSITGNKLLQGQILKDTNQVINVIKNYLPPESRESTIKKAKQQSSYYGLEIAVLAWKQTGKLRYVNAHIKQALMMNATETRLIKQAIKLYIGIFKSTLKTFLG